jgi:hypothetical protein
VSTVRKIDVNHLVSDAGEAGKQPDPVGVAGKRKLWIRMAFDMGCPL